MGVLFGPTGFELIRSHEQVELLASIGISLLLFVVGLKLDVHMIRTVGPAAFTAGLAQVVITSLASFAAALLLGLPVLTAVYVAAGLTFSSTIVVIKLLSDRHETDALHGRLAIGLLIVQDLAVILLMVGLTAAGSGIGSGSRSAVLVTLNAAVFLSGVAALARWALPSFARGLSGIPELLVLFGIAWAIVLAAVAEAIGLNREVGALLAGISLASTPYRDALAARLTTVRDFLLLFFFVDLGVRIEPELLTATLRSALALSAFVVVGKPLIVMTILGAMGYRKRTGFMTGITMGQISEFSLILTTLGLSLGHLGPQASGLMTTVGLLTITLSTYLINAAGGLYERLGPALGLFERRRLRQIVSGPLPPEADVIVFGLGQYGSGIVRHLTLRKKRVVGVDFDPDALARWQRERLPVAYGDAEDPDLLAHLPLDRVSWIVSTAPDVGTSRTLLAHLRQRSFPGKVAVACRTSDEADALQLQGADVLLRPFADAAEQAVDVITSGVDRVASVASAAPGLREVRLGPGSTWAGWTLGLVPLRDQFGVTVLAVGRSGRSVFNPGPDFQLFPGDRLILTGEPGKLDSAVAYVTQVDFSKETEQERDVAVEELSLAASEWQGHSIAELSLRSRFGVTVIAVRRGSGPLSAPDSHRPLAAEDHVVVAGRRADIEQLHETMRGPRRDS